MQTGALAGAAGELDEGVLRQALEGIGQGFDPRWGGFAAAPKFPQPMTLEFLLRCHLRGWPKALEMVQLTLDRMAAGGIFDQLGGGFHRYSTDHRWLVPHFEKMLYDNAQLVRLYARAWQVTGAERHREVARRTADYLLRELRHADGGFFSSQDADSEGEEGRFLVWSYQELVEVAGEPVASFFGALPDGNWEGRNVLWTPFPPEAVAERTGVGVDELERAVLGGRAALLERRAGRVRPATDDKVLAAWNGLTIAALAEAGRVLPEQRYVEAAEAAAEFVLGTMRTPRLRRAWREGRFYQTGSDAEKLVVRPRELFDNAVPAGSSVAAEVLLRLGRLVGSERYEQAALGALRVVQGLFARAPTGFGHALGVADFALSKVREVAIVGAPGAPDTGALLAEVRRRYRPNQVVAMAAPADGEAAAVVPLLADRAPVDGHATAYVCEHFACRQPVTEPDALARQLG